MEERREQAASLMPTVDQLLSEYLVCHPRNIVVIRQTISRRRGAAVELSPTIDTPEHRTNGIRVRIEYVVNEQNPNKFEPPSVKEAAMYIDHGHLRGWLDQQGVEWNAFRRALIGRNIMIRHSDRRPGSTCGRPASAA